MAYKIPKIKSKWQKVGVVGIDSGTLLLGDPAYSKKLNYNKDVVKGMKHSNTLQLKFKKNTGRGVLTETGLGDGEYPVYAKIEKAGEFGTRVKEVKVKFL